jgi:hypothetical protein
MCGNSVSPPMAAELMLADAGFERPTDCVPESVTAVQMRD